MQMFGPLVEEYNHLAPEKIYRLLIPRIRAFSPADLWGQTIISQRGAHGHPRNPPPPPPPLQPQLRPCVQEFSLKVVANASGYLYYMR